MNCINKGIKDLEGSQNIQLQASDERVLINLHPIMGDSQG